MTRARAVLRLLGEDARILSASPLAADPDLALGLSLLPVPGAVRSEAAALGPWLQKQIWTLCPRTLYLDSFPAGLFGELGGLALPPGLRIHYLARLLCWDSYRPLVRGAPPHLHRAYLLEPLEPAHAAWLQRCAGEILPLPLSYPAETNPRVRLAMRRLATLPRPRWLVVHAGADHEIAELLDYARDMAAAEGVSPSLVLLAPAFAGAPGEAEVLLSCYPVQPLFPLADRIISACGFNTMRQTEPFRALHRFLPMPRRFDDQYARAAAARGSHPRKSS